MSIFKNQGAGNFGAPSNLALTDARYYLIPDEFTWGGLVLGLALALGRGGGPGLLDALIGATVGFTLLYLGSSWLPRDLRPLLWAARRRQAPVVLNQNGVAYPAWAGLRVEGINRPLRRALQKHVESPLSISLLSGDFAAGDKILVDVDEAKNALFFRRGDKETKSSIPAEEVSQVEA